MKKIFAALTLAVGLTGLAGAAQAADGNVLTIKEQGIFSAGGGGDGGRKGA